MSSRRDELAADDQQRVPFGTNALVMAPTLDGAKPEACLHLLGGHPPESVAMLHVLYVERPSGRVERVRDRLGAAPAVTHVITIGDEPRERLPGCTVDTVNDPRDLTGLAMSLGGAIDRLAATDRKSVVCFDSVSALVQSTDPQRAFRFLHMATSRLRGIDAASHFHIDPAAHDDKTLARLMQLFDSAVEAESVA